MHDRLDLPRPILLRTLVASGVPREHPQSRMKVKRKRSLINEYRVERSNDKISLVETRLKVFGGRWVFG